MVKRSSPKQHTAQPPHAAAVVQAAAPAAPVQAAPPVVMLLTPAAPPPVEPSSAPRVTVEVGAAPAPEPPPVPSPLTEEECAAFMGVLREPPKAPEPPTEPRRLTTEQRENPRYLSGDALRELAHRRGIARSEAAAMSDDKLRMQLRYIVAHQSEAEAA